MANPIVEVIIRGRDLASRVITGVKRSIKDLNVSLRGLRDAFGAVALTATGLGFIGKKLFDIGSSALETRSKFDTVFGAAADRVRAFGSEFASMAGLARSEGEDIFATTGAIVQGLGYTEQAAADTAIAVVRLAGDIASFNNLPTAEVARTIQSAITGEREQLKRLGIVIHEVHVQQRAMAMSGKESAAALTQQEKAAATMQLITERAGRAVGDLARTSDSAANKAKRLRAEFATIIEDFSVKLLPVLESFLPLLSQLADKMSEFAGPFVEMIKRGADAMGLYSLTAEGAAASMAAVAHNTDLVIQREAELRAKIEETSVAFVEAEAAFASARVGGLGETYVNTQREVRRLRDELKKLQEEYIAVEAAATKALAAQAAQSSVTLGAKPSRGFDVGSIVPGMRDIGRGGAPTVDTRTLAALQTTGKVALEFRDALRSSADLRRQLDAELEPAADAHTNAVQRRTEAEEKATEASERAAISTENFAISLLNTGAQMVRILRGGSGGFGSLVGLVGGLVSGINPLAGAGLGLAGALLSPSGNKSIVPVRLESYGSTAINQQRDLIQPINWTTIVRLDGTDIRTIQQRLYQLSRQDASPRILAPLGGSL